jgi:hypothetical protein
MVFFSNFVISKIWQFFCQKKKAKKDQITLEKQKFPNFGVKTMTKCVGKKTWDMNANKQRIPFTHSQTSILSYALVNLWSILSLALDGPWSLCHGGLGLMPPCPGPPGSQGQIVYNSIFLMLPVNV